MSTKTFAGIAIALSFVAAGVTLTTAASAEDEFDVAVSGNAITVTTKGSWHINKDYPWKVVQGDSKLDKSKFDLGEKSAKVSGAPKGKNVVKGAVCSGDSCKTFEKEVKID
jgi:hypothetical protein